MLYIYFFDVEMFIRIRHIVQANIRLPKFLKKMYFCYHFVLLSAFWDPKQIKKIFI